MCEWPWGWDYPKWPKFEYILYRYVPDNIASSRRCYTAYISVKDIPETVINILIIKIFTTLLPKTKV